ncbi:hypothetical protein [Klenkia terrae]|uniref:VapC45 PIN like domain-containing protein n=1 Tax=Klenkia terrae TaxID=1052259 RepID=A0ABU8EA05_9ACTN|nr:hypothetical protein [Klenkia terrae]
MAALAGVTFFADENCLGMARCLLKEGRDDVVHPGHVLLPDVPLGCPDLEWMATIARHDLVVLTRDRRIRTRPAELTEYRSQGLRVVFLAGKTDRRPSEQAALFLRHETRLRREMVKRGPGPWALTMSERDLRPIDLPDN